MPRDTDKRADRFGAVFPAAWSVVILVVLAAILVIGLITLL